MHEKSNLKNNVNIVMVFIYLVLIYCQMYTKMMTKHIIANGCQIYTVV